MIGTLTGGSGRAYGLTRTGPLATSIVTVAEAKSHMRILGRDAVDTDILAYLCFAEEYLTDTTRHSFQPASFTLTMDRPPAQYGYRILPYGYYNNAIEIPVGPLLAVQAVTFNLTDGSGIGSAPTPTVLDPTTYSVVNGRIPGRVVPAHGTYWPFASVFSLENVRIDFTAGYNGPAPHVARMAVKLLAAYMYENREPLVTANVVGTLPMTLMNLIRNLTLQGMA